jgi:DNA-binding NarL/FixJ family response regulator
MTVEPLRILLIDDHPMLRAGLAAVLSPEAGFRICGEAADGETAIARFDELLPDVALMDLQIPVVDGISAIAKIRERHPDACILVLTMFNTEHDIVRALQAGARGYLLKDASAEQLVAAVRDVSAGRRRVAPAVAATLADRVTQLPLTMRELTVLRLVAEGKSNKDISAALSIAESTVKVHVTHLFEKLEVSNRTEAAAAAVKRGLIWIC